MENDVSIVDINLSGFNLNNVYNIDKNWNIFMLKQDEVETDLEPVNNGAPPIEIPVENGSDLDLV